MIFFVIAAAVFPSFSLYTFGLAWPLFLYPEQHGARVFLLLSLFARGFPFFFGAGLCKYTFIFPFFFWFHPPSGLLPPFLPRLACGFFNFILGGPPVADPPFSFGREPRLFCCDIRRPSFFCTPTIFQDAALPLFFFSFLLFMLVMMRPGETHTFLLLPLPKLFFLPRGERVPQIRRSSPPLFFCVFWSSGHSFSTAL